MESLSTVFHGEIGEMRPFFPRPDPLLDDRGSAVVDDFSLADPNNRRKSGKVVQILTYPDQNHQNDQNNQNAERSLGNIISNGFIPCSTTRF